VFDSRDARLAERAAARDWYLEALREACEVYAEALTPEQRAGLAGVCPLVPCCPRAPRRRRQSQRDLADKIAAMLERLGEQIYGPTE